MSQLCNYKSLKEEKQLYVGQHKARLLEHCVIYLFICESHLDNKEALHEDCIGGSN